MNSLAGRRIMVVEDSFLLAMELRSILEEAGAEVIGPFGTSKDAQRSLKPQMPDCAVLDVKLDGGASFDLARSLRMRGASFLFLTGYDQSAMPAEFAHVTRLEKPVDPARLVQAVRKCCLAAPTPG